MEPLATSDPCAPVGRHQPSCPAGQSNSGASDRKGEGNQYLPLYVPDTSLGI